MRKSNKTIFLTFLLIAVSVLLVACGGANSKNDKVNNSKDDEAEKPYEITLAFLATSNVNDADLVSEEISKITEEKINATVTLLPISPSAWEQQMNLMMTGNEKLDLLVTGSDFGYDLQASKGMLVGLDDLLDEYGSDIKEVVPEDVLEGTRVGEEVYGVPSVRDWARQYGFYMREDLVEKYDINLDEIETYEDLTPIFELIKENEPDVYPIANANTPTAEILTGEDFDILENRLGGVRMDAIEPEVINIFEDPDYIESIELVRDWYNQGFIMKDATTIEDTTAAIIKSGKGFGAFTVLKPGFEIQEAVYTGYDMVSVALTEPYQHTIRSWMMSIARNSEEPEKAMEFMNLLYSDADIMNLIAIGIEGKHYEINDEGFATYADGQSESDYHQSQWQIGNNLLTHVWEGNEADLWEQTEAFNASAIDSPVLGFAFDPDSVKTELASLTNVLEQYREGIEHGVLDPDKNLKEFNKKLKASGLDKIIDEKQRQLDEWLESQE